jgi:hypothetical protein
LRSAYATLPDQALSALVVECDGDDTGKPLGTIGVVISPTGGRTVWRFGDLPPEPVDLVAGRRWTLSTKS